jgi:hypothetical protein
MKKQRREIRTKAGPLIFFLIYVIIGGIIGMTINSRYYEMEGRELNTIRLEP